MNEMNEQEVEEVKPEVEESKVETKPEIPEASETKSVKPAVPVPNPEPNSRVIVSQDDAYVHDIMSSQPKSFEEVDAKVIGPADPTRHRLSLPPELEPYTKKYTFRWLYKHKLALDHAKNNRGWVLVNRTIFSGLPNHLFTVNGSCETGDNILAFMPNDRANQLRKEPGKESIEKMQGMFERHKDDPRYYAPKATVSRVNENGDVVEEPGTATLI